MTNKFFPEEQIRENDLYFLCYMIERVARKLHHIKEQSLREKQPSKSEGCFCIYARKA